MLISSWHVPNASLDIYRTFTNPLSSSSRYRQDPFWRCTEFSTGCFLMSYRVESIPFEVYDVSIERWLTFTLAVSPEVLASLDQNRLPSRTQYCSAADSESTPRHLPDILELLSLKFRWVKLQIFLGIRVWIDGWFNCCIVGIYSRWIAVGP